MKPGSRQADIFVNDLEKCYDLLALEPARALAEARKAEERLKELEPKISRYRYANLQMRTRGIHGIALVKTARLNEAAEMLCSARACRASDTERAILGLRLVQLHTHRGEWAEALKEADQSIRRFRNHPPRPSRDGRSLASALLARAYVLLSAYGRAVKLPGYPDLAREAEKTCRASLKACTPNTPKTALRNLINLCTITTTLWWSEPNNRHSINPHEFAADMNKVYRALKRLGIEKKTVAHAHVRWLSGIAMAQSFGHLNKSAEDRLMNAFEDLLELGAMAEAAKICLDICYWYLQEGRWEDLETAIASVLYHSRATDLPDGWYDMLIVWQRAVESREIGAVITKVFQKIKGIRVPPHVQLSPELNPKHRHRDRADTLGF